MRKVHTGEAQNLQKSWTERERESMAVPRRISKKSRGIQPFSGRSLSPAVLHLQCILILVRRANMLAPLTWIDQSGFMVLTCSTDLFFSMCLGVFILETCNVGEPPLVVRWYLLKARLSHLRALSHAQSTPQCRNVGRHLHTGSARQVYSDV